ncbi:hypothetical protein NQ317_017654 [Molorchus minor]|uniref:CCR4-NOT transcription complex subunit 10 n=1 Tax=Molorchus minor TaxID=1323400 RepID=A0ABQ9ISY7_9CUCU|nr:hypothetical protein NQ317_017654 [Molorchus minor]
MSDKESEKTPEIVTDQERDIAQNALAELKKKNYAACLQHISKLENRANELKVIHNKTVVEYYKNDLKKTEQFHKNLIAICNQFNIKIEKLDEIDHCVVQFNQALLLYHQKQYTDAQRIMDRVYKFIEPMEESLAKQVSLLAIELQLRLRQPNKALTLMNYLENNLMYGGSIPLKGLDKTGKEKKVHLPPPKPLSEEFEKKLLKYKIKCYLMNHALNMASKEIQTLLKDKSNIDAMFLAANIEYLKGNFKEAVKILTSIPNECLVYSDCGESSTVMFYNNMGVIHHAMGKPNLACHYFRTALKEDQNITRNDKKKREYKKYEGLFPSDLGCQYKNLNIYIFLDEKPLYTLGGSRYHEIMYNLGISLLHTGRASQAFECLLIAVRRYHRNSRLWMRLAECCIMVHKETNETDFDIIKKQKELIVDIFGSKEKQKIVLTSNLSRDKKYRCYAACTPSTTWPFTLQSPSPPEGIQTLRNGILIASAYVALCLGDYIIALGHSKELLEQPKISGVHKLLAHLYAAECLVLLDKIQEAIEYLNPEHVKDISFELPPMDDKTEEALVKTNPPPKWFPNNLSSAQAVMHYNIAVAKTIRGQLDQAATLLKQIWQQKSSVCKVPAHIVMLVIYIELQLGHTDIARNLIRQYSFQHRISG